MNKSLSWKILLILAVICFVLKFVVSGGAAGFALEVIGLISLVSGIVGLIKSLKLKSTSKYLKDKTEQKTTSNNITVIYILISILIIGVIYMVLKSFQPEVFPIPIVQENTTPTVAVQPNTPATLPEDNIDPQVKCADIASKYFKEHINDLTLNGIVPTYTNHWNKLLNECFILSTSTTYNKNLNSMDIYEDLIDAIEGKYYGEVDISGNLTVSCGINTKGEIPNSFNSDSVIANRKYCNSQTEFENLINPFMNN